MPARAGPIAVGTPFSTNTSTPIDGILTLPVQSDMQIPVTEAFNDSARFESLPVELRPEQIEWLEEQAADRGLSIGHLLRTIVADRMQGADDPSQALGDSGSRESVPEESGDGTVRPPSVNVPEADPPPAADVENTGTTGAGQEDKADRADSPSLAERLRSASKRLQDLTDGEQPKKDEAGEADDATEHGLRDTLARLQVYARSTSLNEESKAEASKENTPTGTSSADSAPDAGEENTSKTPSRTMLQNKSMFDMMNEA